MAIGDSIKLGKHWVGWVFDVGVFGGIGVIPKVWVTRTCSMEICIYFDA